MTPLKICFAGTPSFAAEHLAALIAAKHNIVAVYTQPDRPSGRGKKLQPSLVKQVALDNGLIIKQPKSLKLADAQQELAAFSPDLLIVVAYGLILPQEILDIPRLGCINVHASLLPRWRGAASTASRRTPAASRRTRRRSPGRGSSCRRASSGTTTSSPR